MEGLKGKGQALPRVLYLVPNGQNPVSYVAPLERRQAIYHVSRKYDLMIVEDDPYFYLQYPYNSEPMLQLAHTASAHSFYMFAIVSKLILQLNVHFFT